MDVPVSNALFKARSAYLPLCCWLLAFIGLTITTTVQATPSSQELEGNWSYHWGDIEYAQGWQFETADWVAVESLEDMEGRTGENILWLKLDLPESLWRDPYLFFSSIDLTVQVFENDQLTYNFGEIDLQGNSRFAGWPWHLIPITSTGSTSLYFRIYSNYPFIGPSGDIKIGEHSDLIEAVLKRGMLGSIFVGLVFIVGIVSACLGLIKEDKGKAISTGLLSFDLALMMFAENELAQVIYYDPLLWRYIAAFSYFLVPVFLAWVVKQWFQHRLDWLVNTIFAAAIAFPIGVALLSGFAGFTFVNAYPVFDGLFIFFMLGLLIACYSRSRKFTVQERLLTLGILALFISLLLDMLSAHELITWIGRSAQWGLVTFTLALLIIYLHKDRLQQKHLRILTNTLEAQVVERTKDLLASQEKLKEMAQLDFLTGMLNRRAFIDLANREMANAMRLKKPVSLILFDIDHFKQINDDHGHTTGDEVLKAISASTLAICRENDLVCRYGGEEFVVLLHASCPEAAKQIATRIQAAIQATEVPCEDGKAISVTGSFGLISYTGFQSSDDQGDPNKARNVLHYLLKEADKAMYEVKNSGRNSIKVYELS